MLRSYGFAWIIFALATGLGSIAIADEVHPTWQWINVFCHEPSFNGAPLIPGDTVRAFDQSGTLCGQFTVRPDGGYGFMAVYRDDGWTPNLDEGAIPGEKISFTLNGMEVISYPEVLWSSLGDKWQVCEFFVCDTLRLQEGWNLVSWNLAYSASIDDFLALFGQCTPDVIYGFDDGAVVYDPLLPEYSTLDSVDYHHGYWIRSSCAAEIPICATRMEETEAVHLNIGWNLVPYWPEEPIGIDDALLALGDAVETVIGFDGACLVWQQGLEAFNSISELTPGKAYWMKSSQEIDFQFDQSPESVPFTNIDSEVPATSIDWMMFYGADMKVDGRSIEDGAELVISTADGDVCLAAAISNGSFKLTPLYGQSQFDCETDWLPVEGDDLNLTLDGIRVYPGITWESGAIKPVPGSLVTDPGRSPGVTPNAYSLEQNRPNPFNPSTSIGFTLAEPGHVRLTVYNLLGQTVTVLVDEFLAAAEHSFVWNSSESGNPPSGIYFYRIQSGEFSETKKMILLK